MKYYQVCNGLLRKKYLKNLCGSDFTTEIMTYGPGLSELINNPFLFLISTELKTKNSFFGSKKSVLVIDCESPAMFYVARSNLHQLGIPFNYVISSHDRFWIVCDCVASNSKIIKFLEKNMLGGSLQFIMNSHKYGKLLLRAVPKYSKDYPIFVENAQFKNFSAFGWWLDLKNYWEKSEHIRSLKGVLFNSKYTEENIFFILF